MFRTGLGKEIEFIDIPKGLLEFYNKTKQFNSEYSLIIGTDSQNHSKTKIVNVICMVCKGHGGRFFYEISNEDLIRDVRTKLQVETMQSLTLADKLIELLEDYEELYFNCPISIHIDAGNSPKGKTKELIPEIVGWVKAYGYDCQIKPDSFGASTIADRISK